MDKLYSNATIRRIKEEHNFRLSKSLGQNFLTDGNIVAKIVDSCEATEEDLVIEIGPGIGVLTAEAAEQAGKVVAVEIDKNLIPILKETLADYSNVTVGNQDILKTDVVKLIEEHGQINGKAPKGVKVIGNLPYYITTPIIMKLLEDHIPCDSITIMMQKEVAERIEAGPGSKTYGALSVAVQYYCEVCYVTTVPKEVFHPHPKVDSAVLRLDLRKEKPVDLIDEDLFFEVIKGGFGQRRKTLHNALTGVRGIAKDRVAEVLAEAGIEANRRAETLSIEEFARIANIIARG